MFLVTPFNQLYVYPFIHLGEDFTAYYGAIILGPDDRIQF